MATAQVKPVSFSEAVLLRPTMYTRGGTFAEVVAFLEGYYSGMANGDPYAPLVAEWEAFRGWLSAQLCVDTSEVFDAFQKRYGGDANALTKLAESLTRFRESKEQGVW